MMKLDPRAEALVFRNKVFFFLDEAGRLRFAELARPVAYPRGHVLFREGEKGDTFYVVAKGTVAVDVDDNGVPLRVGELKPGQFFGEMATVTNQPRSATVTALEDVELLAFEREPVQALLKDYPKLRELLGKVGLARSEDSLQKILHTDP